MKMNKFLMLGIAGLAFAACSNEEELAGQFPEGNGAISIRIVNPVTTRAIVAGNTQNVTVTGPVLITLEADNGNQTIALTANQLEAVTNPTDGTDAEEIKFWNVQGPNKVTVAMNGGQASYDLVSITDNSSVTMSQGVSHQRNMQSVAGVAAYGETSTFTASGLDTPDLSDNVYETGATSSDNGKKYEMYKATVTLAIPVARLEVDGIMHVQTHITTPKDCKYATLTIDGVYMDNIMANGAGVTIATSRVDYKFPGDTGETASGADAILSDAIDPSESFLQNKSWPAAEGQVFAYNFYAPTTAQAAQFTTQAQKNAINPQFKVYFKSATGKGNNEIAAPRYAMITKYRAKGSANPDDEGIVLEAGKIYRIVDAVLDDENIIGDEGGNTQFGVNVVVEEAVWEVVEIKADWAEQ